MTREKGQRVRLGTFIDVALGPSEASNPDLAEVLLAGSVGGWQPGEEIMEAYARAIGYSGLPALRRADKGEVEDRHYLALADLFDARGIGIDDTPMRMDLIRIIALLLAELPDELRTAAEAVGVGAPPPDN